MSTSKKILVVYYSQTGQGKDYVTYSYAVQIAEAACPQWAAADLN